MPASKAVWAIDIGQCSLKALHAKLVGDTIEIDNYVVIPHEQILSQPDADEPALIRQTLQKFTAQNPNIKDPLIISVPGHRSFARFSKLPPVEPKKIPDIVHYEATQQIPFGIDEVVWDYHIFQSENSPEMEVGIFAIKRSIISQYLEYFQELNLRPLRVQTAPVALYNACHYEGLVGKGATIIADVGAQNTNFLVTEDHRLWLRNIPLGGNNFTEALQKSFKLNFAKAEALKCTAATSKYARAVFQSMRPVFSDLSSEFQRSVGFYTSVNRESQITQLLGLGSAFRLPGLLKFLQQNLNVPVRKMESFDKVRLVGGINEAEFSENILALGVAYGLAIQELGLGKINTDLIPPEMARRMAWKRKEYWFAGAAACLVVAAALVWLRVASDSSAIQTDMDQNQPAIAQKINQYNQLRSEYQQYSNIEEQFKSKLVVDFEKLGKDRLLLPGIMNVLFKTMPVQDELASAQTPEEYVKIAQQIPRESRHQVFVDRLRLEYHSNLTDEAVQNLQQGGRTTGGGARSPTRSPAGTPPTPGGPPTPPMSGPPTPPMPGGSPGTPVRRQPEPVGMELGDRSNQAFTVRIEGTTPHANAPDFLNRTVMVELQKINKNYALKEKLPFWVDHVRLVSCQPLISPGDRAARPTDEAAPVDLLTQEPISDDSAFVITCVIRIGESADKTLPVGDDGR